MTARVSEAIGRALQAGVATLRAVRGTRPLHRHGVTLTGTLTPIPHQPASGLGWLDGLEPGVAVAVTGRVSRGAGLPAPLPDIQGLALRIPTARAGDVDILLASSGLSPLGRFGLTLRRSASGARMSTLMPYRGANGPVLLAVIADAAPHLSADLDTAAHTLATDPWHLRLLHATPRGLWHPLADIVVHHDPTARVDSDRRYDAVASAPAENTYGWTRRLREPGYRLSRAGRPVASDTTGEPAGH